MTLRRAKVALSVAVVHEGYGKGSVWQWSLPSKVFKDPKDVKDVILLEWRSLRTLVS